jgi:hypothetical protein
MKQLLQDAHAAVTTVEDVPELRLLPGCVPVRIAISVSITGCEIHPGRMIRLQVQRQRRRS